MGWASRAPAPRHASNSLAYLEVPSSPNVPPPPPAVAAVLVNYNEKLYTDRTARAE